MDHLNDYTVETEGVWRDRSDGTRALVITATDPVNGRRLVEISLPEQHLVDALSSHIRDHAVKAGLDVYSDAVAGYGQTRYVGQVLVRYEYGKDVQHLHLVMSAHNVRFDGRDLSFHNRHRVDKSIHGKDMYRIQCHLFADDVSQVEAAVRAIAAEPDVESVDFSPITPREWP